MHFVHAYSKICFVKSISIPFSPFYFQLLFNFIFTPISSFFNIMMMHLHIFYTEKYPIISVKKNFLFFYYIPVTFVLKNMHFIHVPNYMYPILLIQIILFFLFFFIIFFPLTFFSYIVNKIPYKLF